MDGWKYAKKILNDWVKGNIDSIEKIQAEDLKFKNKNNKQNDLNETEEEKTARKIKELEESIANGSS